MGLEVDIHHYSVCLSVKKNLRTTDKYLENNKYHQEWSTMFQDTKIKVVQMI
jgi:hypothetical protein